MKLLRVLLLCVAATSCAHSRSYSDMELFKKAARGDIVHCWKMDPPKAQSTCHDPGYKEPLRRCLVEVKRTDWPENSLEMAPGDVQVCMAKYGWHHSRLEVTSSS